MLKDAPENFRLYLSHGVELVWEGTRDGVADCPFCGKEEHFFVSQKTGQFTCKVCAEGSKKGGGNHYTFMNKMVQYCSELHFEQSELEELAEERGIAWHTLRDWKVCKSHLNGEWIVPSYNREKKITNLFRYTILDGERLLLSSPGMKNGLLGLNLFDDKCDTVYICEGVWDGAKLWEVMRSIKFNEHGKPLKTNSVSASVLGGASVVAVPGCGNPLEQYATLFKDKSVVLLYDSDHPRKVKNKLVPPGGYTCMEKAVAQIGAEAKSIHIVDWGPDGYDPNLKHGYDIRDFAADNGAVKTCSAFAAGFGDKLIFPPEEWLQPILEKKSQLTGGLGDVTPIECKTYKEVVLAWRKALKWTDIMDTTLSVMLASAASTMMRGDQLWVRVIGPPGSAKTTLCEALSVSKHTFSTSVQKGFHSGWREKGGDEEASDASLIPLINGKTVIIKDGDTLLQSSNRDQTLSELRDIYDGTSRAHYKNKKHSVYHGLRTTFILAGTKSLKKLNRSFLGDRFIDCIIYDRAENEAGLEEEILSRAGFGALRQVREESSESAESRYDPKVLHAMQLTAGYLDYLRTNCKDLIAKVDCPDTVVHTCMRLGEFVSLMRARPDKTDEDDEHEVELATRLTSQFVRLSSMLTIVLNRTKVDSVVMSRVFKVSRDTSRGINWDTVKCIYSESPNGVASKFIHGTTRKPEATVRRNLQFLHAIGAVKPYRRSNKSGAKGRTKNLWELTTRMSKLCAVAMPKPKEKKQPAKVDSDA